MDGELNTFIDDLEKTCQQLAVPDRIKLDLLINGLPNHMKEVMLMKQPLKQLTRVR